MKIIFIVILSIFLISGVNAISIDSISYPLTGSSSCGSLGTCQQVINRWNNATYNDVVDNNITGTVGGISAVRWLVGEQVDPTDSTQGNNGGGSCPILNFSNNQFCGVTDEFGNVLLSFSMGSNQTRYNELHNFSKLLQRPDINNLPCWKYYVNGTKSYTNYTEACVVTDSASDADIRILGAYSIACAKQRAGTWDVDTFNYCQDYLNLGNSIFGLNGQHGDIKVLESGRYYLANGYNNQVNSPTNLQAFRPDYYELQFLMDFAEYKGNTTLTDGVIDMLEAYNYSLGTNYVHIDKTGHFSDLNGTNYVADGALTPPYLDNIDTWRAIPAISALLLVHPSDIPSNLKTNIYDNWYYIYGAGNITYNGTGISRPFEIYSNAIDGGVKQTDNSYKTMSMWIPLTIYYNPTLAVSMVNYLVNNQYQTSTESFSGSGGTYYGAYYSQFAQRAIGLVTGLIDPNSISPISSGSGIIISGSSNTILITLINPLNSSTSTNSNFSLQTQLDNKNITVSQIGVTDPTPYTYVNCTFSSSDCNFLGSFDLIPGTYGYLNLTGNTFSPTLNLTRFNQTESGYNFKLGTSVTTFKVFPLTLVGSLGGDDFYFENTTGGNFTLKHEPSFDTIAPNIAGNSNVTLLIFTNKTSLPNGTFRVNVTWDNGTKSGSILSSVYNFSATQNASVYQNGTGLQISGSILGDIQLHDFWLRNIGNNLTTTTSSQGSSLMNASAYNCSNNALIGSEYNLTTGSATNINWVINSTGIQCWYLNVTSENNNVQSANHYFEITVVNNQTGTGGGSGSCTPNWSCSDYGVCNSNNQQYRTCSDLNSCNDLTGKPLEQRTCENLIEQIINNIKNATSDELVIGIGIFLLLSILIFSSVKKK